MSHVIRKTFEKRPFLPEPGACPVKCIADFTGVRLCGEYFRVDSGRPCPSPFRVRLRRIQFSYPAELPVVLNKTEHFSKVSQGGGACWVCRL